MLAISDPSSVVYNAISAQALLARDRMVSSSTLFGAQLKTIAGVGIFLE